MNAYTHTQKYSYRISLEKKISSMYKFFCTRDQWEKNYKAPTHGSHKSHHANLKKKKHIKHENHSNKHLNNTNEKKWFFLTWRNVGKHKK